MRLALARSANPFVAFAVLCALLAPPVLFMLLRTAGSPGLSPRHLAYALPVWAALVGVGVVRLAAATAWVAVALAAVAAALAARRAGSSIPRDRQSNAILGGGPGRRTWLAGQRRGRSRLLGARARA